MSTCSTKHGSISSCCFIHPRTLTLIHLLHPVVGTIFDRISLNHALIIVVYSNNCFFCRLFFVSSYIGSLRIRLRETLCECQWHWFASCLPVLGSWLTGARLWFPARKSKRRMNVFPNSRRSFSASSPLCCDVETLSNHMRKESLLDDIQALFEIFHP